MEISPEQIQSSLNIPWFHHKSLAPSNDLSCNSFKFDRSDISKIFLTPLSISLKGSSFRGYCVDHHLAHLYSGSAICNDLDYLVISIDGAGSRPINQTPLSYAGLAGRFINNRLESIEAIHFGGGLIYSVGALMADMSEGKLMGLAPI